MGSSCRLTGAILSSDDCSEETGQVRGLTDLPAAGSGFNSAMKRLARLPASPHACRPLEEGTAKLEPLGLGSK
jgi:hypothetical protein